jgi:hypothetical protein
MYVCILQHQRLIGGLIFSRVQDPQNSELVSYIRKLLKSGLGKENANVVRNNDNEEGADDLGAKNGNVRSGIPTIGSSGIPRYSYSAFLKLKLSSVSLQSRIVTSVLQLSLGLFQQHPFIYLIALARLHPI